SYVDQIKSFTVNNDLPGAMNLRDDILNTTKGQSIGVLRIGLESTSVYSFHPSMFLDNDEYLQALGANSVRRHVPEYKDYYAKKYQELPKHQHKRGLVLTARKLVSFVDALLSNNQIYTPKGA